METKKRGRPRSLTDLGRKAKKKERNHASQITRVTLGKELRRWNDLKDKKKFKKHEDVAKFLLDWVVDVTGHLTCSETEGTVTGEEDHTSFSGEELVSLKVKIEQELRVLYLDMRHHAGLSDNDFFRGLLRVYLQKTPLQNSSNLRSDEAMDTTLSHSGLKPICFNKSTISAKVHEQQPHLTEKNLEHSVIMLKKFPTVTTSAVEAFKDPVPVQLYASAQNSKLGEPILKTTTLTPVVKTGQTSKYICVRLADKAEQEEIIKIQTNRIPVGKEQASSEYAKDSGKDPEDFKCKESKDDAASNDQSMLVNLVASGAVKEEQDGDSALNADQHFKICSNKATEKIKSESFDEVVVKTEATDSRFGVVTGKPEVLDAGCSLINDKPLACRRTRRSSSQRFIWREMLRLDESSSDTEDVKPMIDDAKEDPDFQLSNESGLEDNDDDICLNAKKVEKSIANESTDTTQEVNVRYEKSRNASLEPIQCSYCPKKFMSFMRLTTHESRHFSKGFRCKYCSYATTKNRWLKQHMKTMHNDIPPLKQEYLCEICGKQLKNKNELYQHRAAQHGEDGDCRQFMCDKCGKIFHVYTSYKHHMKIHRGKTISCIYNGCNTKFYDNTSMKRHVKLIHLQVREFQCKYIGCGKWFKYKRYLAEHMETVHLKMRNYPCTWPSCTKAFNAKKHLEVHMRIHNDVKPLKCDFCDYSCRQRTAMNWHMRKHQSLIDVGEGSSGMHTMGENYFAEHLNFNAGGSSAEHMDISGPVVAYEIDTSPGLSSSLNLCEGRLNEQMQQSLPSLNEQIQQNLPPDQLEVIKVCEIIDKHVQHSFGKTGK